jgi:hypothetical protein
MRDEFPDRGTSASYEMAGLAAKGRLMEIVNLGKDDGLPPVDWSAVLEKLELGSTPDPAAPNARTTWL